jgi:3-phenylpropionate/cinnamic acid dioxygenase small subunit
LGVLEVVTVELWELIARERIRDLVARYNANADAGRFDEVVALFADDAVMELVSADGKTRSFDGSEAIRSLLAGTKAAWDPGGGRQAAGGRASGSRDRGRHHVRHFVATHQIDVLDRAHARGRSYFLVLTARGLDHWGRYVDEYEPRGGEWRITRRRALSDGHASEALAGLVADLAPGSPPG